MQVASLNLCKELYELSGWNNTEHSYYADPGGLPSLDATGLHHKVAPAYDAGFLLRKLPREIENPRGVLMMQARHNGYYYAYTTKTGQEWPFDERAVVYQIDKTPENALCKLAVELFKAGVLTREAKE